MKPKQAETLADVLDQYLKAIGAHKHLSEMRIKQSWEKVVGAYIARDTVSIAIKDGVFTARFRTPIVRNEISMRRSTIMERLNEEAGEEIITKIEIK